MSTIALHVLQLTFIWILSTALWKGEQCHCQNIFKFWLTPMSI